MDELGIAVGVHYQAIHKFSAYRKLGISSRGELGAALATT